MNETSETRDQLALLQEIAEALRGLVAWTRVIGYPAVRQALTAILDSDEKRLVYHLTDGQRGMKEIQELTGVNVRFVSEWGREWEKIGIVEPSRTSGIKGRRQRIFDLPALGIPVPDRTGQEAR